MGAKHHHRSPLINPPANGLWIIVSEKSPHTIHLYKDGALQGSITHFDTGGMWPTGPHHEMQPHFTPQGKFKVFFQQEKGHTSPKYGHAPMPLYTKFASEVGFHVGNADHISHGCVHLTEPDARVIFHFASVFETKPVHVWVLPADHWNELHPGQHHQEPGQHRKRA